MPIPHYSTGLKTLDALLGDFCPGIPRHGGVTLIVGGTGSGKSSLCELIAYAAADQGARVGFASIENRRDPANLPYNVLNPRGWEELAIAVFRSGYDLLIIDGFQYLDLQLGSNDLVSSGIATRNRYLLTLLSGSYNYPTLVFTWQSSRDEVPEFNTPSSITHRASLILSLENCGKLIRVVRNRFGESGGVCNFGERWTELPPKPEFDRSKIPTRFEREDVI
jgi:energy-coupling factor transporter ATP-binding protein EcfA2